MLSVQPFIVEIVHEMLSQYYQIATMQHILVYNVFIVHPIDISLFLFHWSLKLNRNLFNAHIHLLRIICGTLFADGMYWYCLLLNAKLMTLNVPQMYQLNFILFSSCVCVCVSRTVWSVYYIYVLYIRWHRKCVYRYMIWYKGKCKFCT